MNQFGLRIKSKLDAKLIPYTYNPKYHSFLENCNLPSLNEGERDELGAEITTKDIVETIKSLKSGKTPGPDGLNNEFYKKFNDLISPRLQALYIKHLKNRFYHKVLLNQLLH